jgi:hypothetical protein
MLRQEWAILGRVGRGGVPAALNITGVTVFVPTKISSDDRALILNDLSVMY